MALLGGQGPGGGGLGGGGARSTASVSSQVLALRSSGDGCVITDLDTVSNHGLIGLRVAVAAGADRAQTVSDVDSDPQSCARSSSDSSPGALSSCHSVSIIRCTAYAHKSMVAFPSALRTPRLVAWRSSRGMAAACEHCACIERSGLEPACFETQ